MTNFFPHQNVYDGNANAPAFSPQGQAVQVYPPAPQNTPSQALTTQLAAGLLPVDTQPTNVVAPPGATSLLAQLGTGQMSLNQTNYGQAGAVPITNASPATPINTVVTGPASGVTIASPPVYAGS